MAVSVPRVVGCVSEILAFSSWSRRSVTRADISGSLLPVTVARCSHEEMSSTNFVGTVPRALGGRAVSVPSDGLVLTTSKLSATRLSSVRTSAGRLGEANALSMSFCKASTEASSGVYVRSMAVPCSPEIALLRI